MGSGESTGGVQHTNEAVSSKFQSASSSSRLEVLNYFLEKLESAEAQGKTLAEFKQEIVQQRNDAIGVTTDEIISSGQADSRPKSSRAHKMHPRTMPKSSLETDGESAVEISDSDIQVASNDTVSKELKSLAGAPPKLTEFDCVVKIGSDSYKTASGKLGISFNMDGKKMKLTQVAPSGAAGMLADAVHVGWEWYYMEYTSSDGKTSKFKSGKEIETWKTNLPAQIDLTQKIGVALTKDFILKFRGQAPR